MLELGNPRTGKVIFLKKLGLITSEHSKQIRELSKLRNECAHKVSDASKTIEDKFRDFDKQQRKNFLGAFPVESTLIARLMKEFTNYKSLPAIDPESLISALKNKVKHYDFKLQIWLCFGQLVKVVRQGGYSLVL